MFNTSNYLDDYEAAQIPQHDPSPPMECLYEAVRQYRLQSPDHFELHVKVQQVSRSYSQSASTNPKDRTFTISLDVLFCGNSIEGSIRVPVQCHLQRSARRSKKKRWTCLAVSSNATVEGLDTFLASTFPIIDGPLRHDTLSLWWLANGKSFDWTALPTELKERVIEHCMHQPRTHGIFNGRLERFNWCNKADHEIRRPGTFEIIKQLGDWFSLLSVSHQVRAITLRLCISGGSTLTHTEGLCVSVASYRELRDCMGRLKDYYQMTTPNGVPVSPIEHALSKCYERFPKIYPHLNRFATLRHGIQKIDISMDWLSFMHFFKVHVGGFERYQTSFRRFHQTKALTYDIFERLPCLNEIVIRLPLRPYGGWRDKAGQCGPQLWHVDSPCPRKVHRVIYERVAEVLAPYNVTMRNLIDYAEVRRYEAARAKAVKALEFTKVELEELYAEDGGGVELSEHEKGRSEELELARRKKEREVADVGDVQDGFWPPLCFCNEPCILARVLTARKHHG
ncbi:hypothetical protein N0V87_002788 [Didymella glomerata]|jgi:hypothetical protein|uniref:Uncharacterized protein n=1 Tax=Didymella glomerata TaxID=749621 RepID=A0A9W8X4Q4_9PLEO|nr:hypothetical protein N0V87_002788 [Didymella glomerata]